MHEPLCVSFMHFSMQIINWAFVQFTHWMRLKLDLTVLQIHRIMRSAVFRLVGQNTERNPRTRIGFYFSDTSRNKLQSSERNLWYYVENTRMSDWSIHFAVPWIFCLLVFWSGVTSFFAFVSFLFRLYGVRVFTFVHGCCTSLRHTLVGTGNRVAQSVDHCVSAWCCAACQRNQGRPWWHRKWTHFSTSVSLSLSLSLHVSFTVLFHFIFPIWFSYCCSYLPTVCSIYRSFLCK